MPTFRGAGHHHFFRIRGKEYQLIPTREDLVVFCDKTVYLVGLISPIMTLPQIIIIFRNGSADGIVASSWITYLFVSFFWLIYGILHREKPIIFINSAWILIHAMMVTGIYIYS